MSIEYLAGIKPGAKIDLPEKRPRLNPEKLLPVLKQQLAIKAEKYNQEYGRDWLEEDGSIKPFGGDVLKETEITLAQEEQWAIESGKTLEQWQEDKEINPANLTEMALTLMLQRTLPERFMVVRPSTYDDYNNGFDQLIIDKTTGVAVCGIDEVIGLDGNKGPSKKEKKIKDKMLRGGVKAKYGVSVRNDSLSFKALQNLPAFYLSLEKDELVKLGESLEKETASEYEHNLLSRLKESLSDQIESYSSLNLNENLRSNLNTFIQSLGGW